MALVHSFLCCLLFTLGAAYRSNYGYEACKSWWSEHGGASTQVDAQKIATLVVISTGDMRAGRLGRVDGCGSVDAHACYNLCVAAVIQAMGECQHASPFMSENKGSCVVNSNGTGGLSGEVVQRAALEHARRYLSPEAQAATLYALLKPVFAAGAH